VRAFLRENSLSLFFATLFAVTLVAQSFAGQHQYNAEQSAHGEAAVSWPTYVRSEDFWGSVMENWQSEFLQFALFIAATIWLVQKGSNESKQLDEAGIESDERQRVGRHADPHSPWPARVGGLWARLYENSLLLVMGTIFLATWALQSLNNWRAFNEEQLAHDQATVSWGSYLANADFWERTFENWQSEFLAVGTLAVFTIYLRQRGSPESKPVGARHDETGTSG
jgi:uncharacterized protein DUF6766